MIPRKEQPLDLQQYLETRRDQADRYLKKYIEERCDEEISALWGKQD